MGKFSYLEKFLNKQSDIHSVMNIKISTGEITPANLLVNQKFDGKYTPIYLNSDFSKEIIHLDSIFQHPSGFYIYLSRESVNEDFSMVIIYKAEKYEEVKIYINHLKKIK